MQLEMIPCPKCGNDFPKKRKELGYHVCINCSTVKPKVAITTVEGEGDHTYNDIIIMDQDQAMAIARKAAELSGMRADLEVIDFDTEADENEVSQSIKDQVSRLIEDDEEDAPISSVDDTLQGLKGIDY
jgi:hypothetical protein